MEKSASFSPCRRYRYALWRKWPDLLSQASGYAMFIGLNPSTADETIEDPTVRRCMAFAKVWGYEALCMTNLFAWRATLPADMRAAADPIGPSNDKALRELASNADVIVAAWGTHGAYLDRAKAVRAMLPQLHYLRLTKEAYPGHPLYLPKSLKPIKWAQLK